MPKVLVCQPGSLDVHRLDLLEAGDLRGNVLRLLAVELVADANRNLRLLVEHVELGHHQPARAVDHVGIAQQRQIEPAGASRTSGDGAELVAFLAQRLADRVFRFRRERPFADARAIRLGHADDRLIEVGGTPVPVAAPPEVALDDVTNG